MTFAEFFEAQDTIERLKGQSPYLAIRKKGVLAKGDPLHQFAMPTIKDLNIVWITGMWSGMIPGTGNYGALLKPLGYNIRTVKTKAAPLIAGLGRIGNELDWTPNFIKNAGQQHIEKNRIQSKKEMSNKSPDIIVGSSQGGAIALSMASDHPDVPMLLICPAWRIFHITPTYINPNSIIVHGVHDHDVPIEDSQYLSKKFGIPLIPTDDGHIIIKGFFQIVKALQTISNRVLKQ